MIYIKRALPKFNDENVWEELKTLCYRGTLDYSYFPAEEYRYFDRLRKIYEAYKFEGLPKEEAMKKQREILKEYKQGMEKLSYSLKVHKEYQENIKKSRELTNQIYEADTAGEKLKPALECIGMFIGDKSFRNMNGV